MLSLIPLLVAIGSLVIGSAKINKLIGEAKANAQEIILKAKNKAVKALDELKKEEIRREEEARNIRQHLQKKDEILDERISKLEENEKDLRKKAETVRDIKIELEKLKENEIKKLEKISKLSQDQARKEIISLIEDKNKEEIFAKIQKLEKHGKEELEKKAKDIIVSTMQRLASNHTAEATTTSVSLPSDDIKGKIIGKEGRNIKTLEKLTGVEVIIDDTPETILISGFNPIRRHIKQNRKLIRKLKKLERQLFMMLVLLV